MRTVKQRYRHLRRLQTIIQVLIGHGFGELVEQLGLARYLEIPRRVFRREPPSEMMALTTPQRLRLAVQELGPTFIKLAQVLSIRPDIVPPPYLKELAKLQDKVQPSPWPGILERIEKELGASLNDVFTEFEQEPLAVASLAQVHKAKLPGGDKVVVKVQKPGIENVIETDLEILFDLAKFVQAHTHLGKIYDLSGIAEEFAYTLRAEMDYRQEGRNADQFRSNFAQDTNLKIPKVYWEYTTQRVIVFERLAGIKIDDIDAIKAANLDPHQVALIAARMLVKEVLEDGMFHADPHPGNFFIMKNSEGEAVIGAMDFGMVGYVTPTLKQDLVSLFIVAAQLDSENIVEQLIRMSAAQRQVDQTGLQRDLERLLRRYYGRPLKEIHARELVEEIMPIAFRYQIQLPSDLWLLGKTLAMMEGVGLKLDPDFDIFAVAKPFTQRMIRQRIDPRLWGRKMLKGAEDWSDLMLNLPIKLTNLMDLVKEGELNLGFRILDRDPILNRLDRLGNRLAISILVASLIVGMALLVINQEGNSWLAVTGFMIATLLGIYLLISILRSNR